jgi:heptosyltransferase II
MKSQHGYRSFLVINTFGIGDVLFSTPLLRNLRKRFPAAKIYYLCNKKTASLLRSHPLVDKVFVYERDDFVAEQKISFIGGIGKYLRFISAIKNERIECAIDLSLNAPFGFFALLAGIKKRYGLDYKGRSRFLNRKVKIGGFTDKHVADYYLDTLGLLGIDPERSGLEVYADPVSSAWAGDVLNKNHISKDDLIVGVAPCGGAAFGRDNRLRRWPVESFARLIDMMTLELKAKVLIFAGPDEKEDVNAIIGLLKNRGSAFEFCDTTLNETVALVEKCRLFVSNDTGILRFADGMNKKIVALYGPIDEKVYGPYCFDDSRVIILKKDLPCRPCYNRFRIAPCANDRKCLTGISVDEVMSAVKRLIEVP